MAPSRRRPGGLARTARRSVAAALVWTLAAVVFTAPPGAGDPAEAADPPEPRGIEQACPPDQVPAAGFDDIAGSVHEPAIDCVAWWAITRGVTDNAYAPAAAVSRDQMASFLARSLRHADADLPTDPPDAFADDDGSVHEDAINQLAAVGITKGATQNRYDPRGSISRAQMASFLDRVYAHRSGDTLPAGEDAFGDDDGSVHEDAIDRITAAGLAAGKTDGTYDPSGPVTRAQMATFLARLLALLVDDGYATPPGTTVPTDEALDCERHDYPCSWAQADRAVYEASLDLGLEADQRHVDGQPLSAVADWLADQPEVVDVKSDDDLVFRLDGGLPVWVVGDETQSIVGPPQPGDVEQASAATPQQADASQDAAVAKHGVAGTDPEAKTAIVLSPYAWEFDTQEGAKVAEILDNTRGYEGNITFLANTYDEKAKEAKLEVTLDAFRTALTHDVAHIYTHGGYACDAAGKCHTRLSTGLDIVDLVPRDFVEVKDYPGVTVEIKEGRTAIAVMDDALRNSFRAKPGNSAAALEDTLVYFSACRSLQGWDVAETIGAHGVYVGWDDRVHLGDAVEAAEAFYTTLSEEGVTTEEALKRLTDEGLSEGRDGAMLWAAGSQDVRLREIVTMEHLIDGSRLESDDDVAVLDADEDQVVLPVRVDGVLDDQASEFKVRLKINDQPSPTSYTLDFLATQVDTTPDGTETYRIDGEWDLPAGTDTDAPLDLEAVADLPEGGESRHIVNEVGAGPLSGILTMQFNGSASGCHGPLGMCVIFDEVDTQWSATLTIRTAPKRVREESLGVRDGFEYPDDGSTVEFSGSHHYESCQEASECDKTIDETFEAYGPVGIDGGDLKVIEDDDGVWLSTGFPVTRTRTTQRRGQDDETITHRGVWDGWKCYSRGQWWHDEGGWDRRGGFSRPGGDRLSGTWTNGQALEFSCQEQWTLVNPSYLQGEGSASFSASGTLASSDL